MDTQNKEFNAENAKSFYQELVKRGAAKESGMDGVLDKLQDPNNGKLYYQELVKRGAAKQEGLDGFMKALYGSAPKGVSKDNTPTPAQTDYPAPVQQPGTKPEGPQRDDTEWQEKAKARIGFNPDSFQGLGVNGEPFQVRPKGLQENIKDALEDDIYTRIGNNASIMDNVEQKRQDGTATEDDEKLYDTARKKNRELYLRVTKSRKDEIARALKMETDITSKKLDESRSSVPGFVQAIMRADNPSPSAAFAAEEKRMREMNPRIEFLARSLNHLEEAEKYLSLDEDKSWWGRVGDGIATAFDIKNIGTLGMYSIDEAAAISRALNNVSEGKASDDEKELVEAFTLACEAQGLYKGGNAFAIGQGLEQSLEFMLEMAATGGVIKGIGEGITKGIEKGFVKGVTNRIKNTVLKKAANGILTAPVKMVGGAAATMISPSTYVKTAERQQGNYNNYLDYTGQLVVEKADNPESRMRSLFNASLENGISRFVERGIGPVSEKALGFVASKIPFKIDLFKNASPLISSIRKTFKELMSFQGFTAETLEEFIEEPIQRLLVAQTATEKESGMERGPLYDEDFVLQTLGTVGLMQAALSLPSAVSAGNNTLHVKRALVRHRKHLQDGVVNQINALFDSDMSDTERARSIEAILRNAIPSEREHILGYFAAKIGNEIGRTERYVSVFNPEVEKYRTSLTAASAQGGNILFTTDRDGNTYAYDPNPKDPTSCVAFRVSEDENGDLVFGKPEMRSMEDFAGGETRSVSIDELLAEKVERIEQLDKAERAAEDEEIRQEALPQITENSRVILPANSIVACFSDALGEHERNIAFGEGGRIVVANGYQPNEQDVLIPCIAYRNGNTEQGTSVFVPKTDLQRLLKDNRKPDDEGPAETGESSVSVDENKVATAADGGTYTEAAEENGIIGRSATDEEATGIIAQMEANAEEAPEVELTPENWTKQFGDDGEVETPIGTVKMGEGQYLKLAQQGREGKLGMIKPTLENPDVIIEDKSQAKDGQKTERPYSYVFVKAFTGENGERRYLFTSVTVQKDGREVSISSQEKEKGRIKRLMKDGRLAYIKEATLPLESGSSIQGNQPTAQTGAGLSENKGTEVSEENQVRLPENPVQTQYEALLAENEGDEAEAVDTATQMVSNTQAELDKAQKAATNGKTVEAIQAAKRAKREKVAALEKELKFWKDVAGYPEAKRQAEEATRKMQKRIDAQQRAEQARKNNPLRLRLMDRENALGEPLSLEEYVLRRIATGATKFLWNGTSQGTGGLKEHGGGKQFMLQYVDNNLGKVPEVVADDMEQDIRDNYPEFGNVTASEILDVIEGIGVGEQSFSDLMTRAEELHNRNDYDAQAREEAEEAEREERANEEAAAEHARQSVESLSDEEYEALSAPKEQVQEEPKQPTETERAIASAEAQTDTNPTEKQKEAGNYRKGHVKVNGFDITIENPKGSERSGVDGTGRAWRHTMNNTYGYIRGTEGVDGDHIDVFLSNTPESGDVFVVDQVNPGTGAFDEHKVMMGFDSEAAAREAYLSNYEDGWQGLGGITRVSQEEFKKWIDSSHRKRKPFADYKSVNASGNKLVTDERYAELRERLKRKLGGQLNSGIDAEILAIGVEMAVYHIEKGVRKFGDFAKLMIDDLGDQIRPYLKSFYNGARDFPQLAPEIADELTPYDEVRKFDVQSIGTHKNYDNENDRKTEADTAALADKGAAVASKAESISATSEDTNELNRAAEEIDQTIEEINDQLALLGYYEAEEVANDMHEAYGYMLNAEKKAVADAVRLTKQLVEDLGVNLDKVTSKRTLQKGKGNPVVSANIAPAGGDITIRLPLNEGRQLAIYLSLEPTSAERGGNYLQMGGGDNLYLDHIMYRIESPNVSGPERYGINRWIRPQDATYNYILPLFRLEAKDYLPTEERPQKAVENIRKPKKEEKIGDLFGNLFTLQNEKPDSDEHDNGGNGVTVRSGRMPSDDNEVGERGSRGIDSQEVQQESGRTDGSRAEGSRGTDGEISESDRRPIRYVQRLEERNTRNNHVDRGTDSAPTSIRARIEANIDAIELANQLIESGEEATPEQMAVLRKFSGWGGLGAAFSEYNYSSKLRKLLGEEAFDQAQMSRNSAFFTPASVIDALWDVAEAFGFKGGKVLEGSAGIGNILGLMPRHLSGHSDIQAIEIDETTGKILKLLYPDADVRIQGFETVRIPNNSVDLAITNVPFVTGLNVMDESGDKDLSTKFRNIHDFCIAKNVRKLKAGGLGIFITSNGTLDKSKKLRDWLVNEGNADVVGAFRLNNETFGGAGVTSDIIIVRKRVNGKKSANAIDVSETATPRTVQYKETDEKGKSVKKEYPVTYNKYFVEHPEHVAGEHKLALENGDTYRERSLGVYPVSGKNQSEMLSDWAKHFSSMEWEATEEAPTEDNSYILDASADGHRLGEMYEKDGKLVVAGFGGYYPLSVNSNKVKGYTKEECFKDYAAIKEALADVLKYQTENEEDSGLKPLLDRLNAAYDKFVSRYGNLNNNTAISFLKNDVEFAGTAAIENFKEEGNKDGSRKHTYSKSDVFKQRVVNNAKAPKPTNIKDGIVASIHKTGRIDIDFLVEQLGKSREEVKDEIIQEGLGFEDPLSGNIEIAYRYLSGNVRDKLKIAEESNEDGRFKKNIAALKKVIPQDIPAHIIDFQLGSSWVPPQLFIDYVKEKTDVDVSLHNIGGSWIMEPKTYTNNEKNRSGGVRSRMLGKLIPLHELIEAAIQNKTIRVAKTEKTGTTTRTVVDNDATTACAAKIDEIKQEFKEWAKEKMKSDPEMAASIEKTFNEQFNNFVPVNIPDELIPLHFSGANLNISMRSHQAKGAILATTQPVLLAHEVGTGKTFTLITAAMEMRRIGTAKKPMIVVQNSTVGQFVDDAKTLYPNAKILTLNENERGEEGRKAFYAKIKYNDWDLIVIPQSTFERIPDSEERQQAFIEAKIAEKEAVLEMMKQAGNGQNNSFAMRQAKKELEKLREDSDKVAVEASKKMKARDEKRAAIARQNAEVRAKELLDRAVDDVENFDDMGIDALLVDEAHEYKHLGFSTAIQRGVKGVDPSPSKKSQGVFLKVQSVLEKNNGKNVVFATGTPVSNTAAEVWTFMRYLLPSDVMRGYGIEYFDDFVRNFGNISQQLEFQASGKFKENNRFTGYINVPELMRIWAGVADTVLTTETDVARKIPRTTKDVEADPNFEDVKTFGRPEDLFLPQTLALRSVMKYVREGFARYEKMSGKEKKENSHIPLVLFGLAKAAAVDARLVMDDAADEENSKTNETVRQVLKDLKQTESYKGTVAIFADNYQNKNTGFNIYEDIRSKLIANGVPPEQVFVMKSGMSDKKKLEVFRKVNSGEIRVILGSTFTLGTGVNIQERMHMLVHLDAPNRPMDYIQRNGRLLRQGNLHNKWGLPVRVLRLGVEDSLDVTAYQRLKTKAAIVNSVMHGREMIANSMTERTLEEEEDVFGEAVAQLSGSEYAMLKHKAERDVRKYTAKKKSWEDDQTYINNQKPKLKGLIRNAENRKEANEKALNALKGVSENKIEINGKAYDNIDALGDFFKDLNAKQNKRKEEVKKTQSDTPVVSKLPIKVEGIEFVITTDISSKVEEKQGSLFSASSTRITYDCPTLGLESEPVNGQWVKGAVEEIVKDVITGDMFRERLQAAETSIERYKCELSQMEAREGVPFQFADELEDAKKKLEEYEQKMIDELAAKEEKYREMDESVATATSLSEAVESTEEDAEDDAEGPKFAGEIIEKHMKVRDEAVEESTKVDGTWLKAPNGKPTKLTPRQWVQVRTKAFKDWFGDWELATKAVNIVSAMAEHGFKNFAEARDWAKKNIVGVVNHNEIGNINISNTSIDKYLSQKAVDKSENMDVHLSALKVLPDVIRNSVVGEIHADKNGDTNIKDVVRLFGCLRLDGKLYRVKTTVKRYSDRKNIDKAYSYEITKIELLEGNGAPHTQRADFAPTSNNSISVAKLLQGVKKSNSDEEILNVSKVVDENGEPLVVYHGTPNKFTTFDASHIGETSGDRGLFGAGFYFNPSAAYVKNIFAGKNGYVVPVFLNIKNPYIVEDHDINELSKFLGGISKVEMHQFHKHDPVTQIKVLSAKREDILSENLKKAGYDGVLTRDYDPEQLVAFSPTQIKSATDNVGTFDEENPDIRYRFIGEKGAANLDKAEESPETEVLGNAVADILRDAGIKVHEVSAEQAWEMVQKAEMSSAATNARENHAPDTHVLNAIRSTDISKIRKDAEKANTEITDHVQFMETPQGEVYGWTVGGEVYLNREAMNPDTPIHEYTHLWDKALRKANPELWKRGVELMKNLPLWKEILNDPNYAGIRKDEDAVASEVHARLSGEEGARILDDMVEDGRKRGILGVAEAVGLKERIKAWVRDVLVWVRNAWDKWSGRDLSNLSIDEFAAMPVKDLMNGLNPLAKASQRNKVREVAGLVKKGGLRGAFGEEQYRNFTDSLEGRLLAIGEKDDVQTVLDRMSDVGAGEDVQRAVYDAVRKLLHANGIDDILDSEIDVFLYANAHPLDEATFGAERYVHEMMMDDLEQAADLERDSIEEGSIQFKKALTGSERAALTILDKSGDITKKKDGDGMSTAELGLEMYELLNKDIRLKLLNEHLLRNGGKVTENTDLYVRHTQINGKVAYQSGKFERKQGKTLEEAAKAVVKAAKCSMYDLDCYLMAKHMPERSQWFFAKDVTDDMIHGLVDSKLRPLFAEKGIDLALTDKEIENLSEQVVNGMADKSGYMDTKHAEDVVDALIGLLTERYDPEIVEGLSAQRDDLVDTFLSDVADTAKKRRKRSGEDYSGMTGFKERLGNKPEEYVAMFEKRVGDRALLDNLHRAVADVAQFSMDNAVETGYMSEEERDAILARSWRFYVPLRSWDEKNNGSDYFIGIDYGDSAREQGYVQKPKRAEGRVSMPDSPLEFLMYDAYGSIRSKEMNEYYKAAGHLQEANGKFDYIFGRPDPLKETAYEKRAHSVVYYEDGVQKEAVFVNPLLADVIRDENVASGRGSSRLFNKYYKKAQNGTRAISALVTQFSPRFSFSNFFRDMFYSLEKAVADGRYFGIGRAAKLLLFIFKNIGTAVASTNDRYVYESDRKGAKRVRAFMENGGDTGWHTINNRKQTKEILRKTLENGDTRKALREAFEVGKEAFRFLSVVSERTVRLGNFEYAKRVKKMSDSMAANYAKESSTNFDRRGRLADTAVGSLFTFLNAQCQGIDNAIQLTRKNPRNMASLMLLDFSIGLLQSIIQGALTDGDDDKDYNNRSWWNRSRSYVIGGLLIPVGHFHVLFHGLGVAVGDYINGICNKKEMAVNMLHAVGQELLPGPTNLSTFIDYDPILDRIKATDNGLATIVPSLAVPAMEAFVTNRDFKGADINRVPFTETGKKLTPWVARAKNPNPYLDRLLVKVAMLSGYNPEMDKNVSVKKDNRTLYVGSRLNSASTWEHLIKGYLGDPASIVNGVSRIIAKAKSEDEDVSLKDFNFINGLWRPVDSDGAIMAKFMRLSEIANNNEAAKKAQEKQLNGAVAYTEHVGENVAQAFARYLGLTLQDAYSLADLFRNMEDTVDQLRRLQEAPISKEVDEAIKDLKIQLMEQANRFELYLLSVRDPKRAERINRRKNRFAGDYINVED